MRQLFRRVVLRLLLAFGSGGLPLLGVSAELPDADSKKRMEAAIAAQLAHLRQLAAETPEAKKEREIARVRRGRLPLPTDGYDWQTTAKQRGLTDSECELLARQKLLMGGREMRQSFDVYRHPTVPVFITSDSALNAFHALFADTFRELETRRAPELRTRLEQTVKNVRKLLQSPPFPAAELAPGWSQAQRAVGPAMVLLGTSLTFFDAELHKDISAAVERIRAANAVDLPRWLEPATESFLAIDYRRMQPIGFYASWPSLGNYFRAVRWLQTIPFRASRDSELTAIALLARGAGVTVASDRDFFSAYTNFLGRPDQRWLADASNLLPAPSGQTPATNWAASLKAARRWLKPNPSPVNDDLRLAPRDEEVSFRMLPSYLLPDAELFQRLTDRDEPVTGLHVAALARSEWATARLNCRDAQFVAKALADARGSADWPRGGPDERTPVYYNYLSVLQSLFSPADPDAPAFMGSEAWSAKSTQASLAGWTQMRHAFTLQAKLTVMAVGLHEQPPGFIEPNPVFFRRFSEFLAHTHAKLDDAGVFTANRFSAAAVLRARAALADRLLVKLPAAGTMETIPEFTELRDAFGSTEMWDEVPDSNEAHDQVRKIQQLLHEEPAALRKALPAFSAYLKTAAGGMEEGKVTLPAVRSKWQTLSHRWDVLRQTIARLETLLQKQLRQRPWTEEESEFIKAYGSSMAVVMGYFGNAFTPRDDAPKCVEVVRFPERGESLLAAIGRPRVLYVLYPWMDLEVLCEGAVMPYREFHSRVQLTDEQWRRQLDRPGAPAEPSWILPLTSARKGN
jgi:hypothetical protein